MSAATLDRADQNISDVRKKTAGMESRRENEPEQIIARELTRVFQSLGGRFSLFNEAETLKIAEKVCGIIVERGWRIHKDQPVCHECRKPVADRAAAAKQWAQTEGAEKVRQIQAIAGQMVSRESGE